jgi:hypothetical protein
LDHFELSKKTGELLRRATIQCEDEGGYSRSLPKFYLGHSLGSKLLGIALSASGSVKDVDGIGFMSYNNFGFRDTLSMVKDFAKDLNFPGGFGGGSSVGIGSGMNGAWNLDSILNFAGEAMSMMGIEFTPDPSTMDRILALRYNEDLQKKTRLFIFDQDDLDCSQSFMDSCNQGLEKRNVQGQEKGQEQGQEQGQKSRVSPSISRLRGNHLSPVYLQVTMEDLYSLDIPEEALPYVSEASGGFQSASFGDEQSMNGAVNEICAWILGKDVSNTSSSNSVGDGGSAGRTASAGTAAANG